MNERELKLILRLGNFAILASIFTKTGLMMFGITLMVLAILKFRERDRKFANPAKISGIS